MNDHGRSFRKMDRARHLDDKGLRQAYVTTMFEVIAPRYDDFTRWFSFGMDSGWKRELLEVAGRHLGPDGRVVDLACGTGDLALALAAKAPAGSVTGIDAAENMIRLARERMAAAGVGNCRFEVGDMMGTGLLDASADVVTVGYGLRNVPDAGGALREIVRILKPGGVAACLDFTKPGPMWWRWLFIEYLRLAGWLYGMAWHRHGKVYSYIAESIRRFLTGRELAEAARQAGLDVVLERRKLFGGVCLLVGRRPA